MTPATGRKATDRERAALLHILTEDDRKRKYPGGALGVMFHALGSAEESDDIVQGILDNFTHTRMRDKMLRAVGQTPCDCHRQGSCRLCRN